MNSDQLAARLLVTFVDELDEQVRVLNADLLALESAPEDPERLKSLFRVAHTLKGAARAVAVKPIESACHALETLLVEVREGRMTMGPEQFAILFESADALGDASARLREGRGLADSPIAALVIPGARTTPRKQAQRTARPASPPRTPPLPQGAHRDGQIRIDGERLDALLAATEQLLITTGHTAGRPAELKALHDSTRRSVGQWSRTARQVRLALERTPASGPVVRAASVMSESFEALLAGTARSAAVAAEDARTLSQATAAVADQARRLRLRPFAEACEALPRMVRDLADAAGKEMRLDIVGGNVEVDRSVLDGLRDALLHLVRNAADHGIESPARRRRSGKSVSGLVTVAAALLGDRLVVTVTDDGAGLDVAALRTLSEGRGLPVGADERDLVRMLFEGGISTRAEPTSISGRGVGLDAVRDAVARVRGTIGVDWVVGGGTTFTLECPPSLTTLRALLVSVGPQVLALPTAYVDRILRVRAREIQRAEGREVIQTSGSPVPLVPLARLLPPLVGRTPADPRLVVLLRAGDRRLAVAVDELQVEQQLVLRPLSREGGAIPGVSGAAILGLGRVALVLDPVVLVPAGLRLEGGVEAAAAPPAEGGSRKRRVLVVDDSITTRTLEQSILEAAGYEVLTAVDGADAWRTLQEQGCDAIVADVEMPRMDGFGLCEAVRASQRFRALPVVLVTALEEPAQRMRGLEAGADAYLGKSSFNQRHLLETLAQLVGDIEP